MTTPEAVSHLISELKKDEGYYYSWQANIAMAFKDEFHRQAGQPGEVKHVNSDDIHEIANQAAKNFLNLLISDCDKQ